MFYQSQENTVLSHGDGGTVDSFTVSLDSPNDRRMMTSSNGIIFRVTGPLCGEFTGPRWIPLTKASDAEFDVFFDLHLNKRLSKQSWGWWFETPTRYYDVIVMDLFSVMARVKSKSQKLYLNSAYAKK